MLMRDIIVAYCENYTKKINSVGEMKSFFMLKKVFVTTVF
jgi:hypothetical protein